MAGIYSWWVHLEELPANWMPFESIMCFNVGGRMYVGPTSVHKHSFRHDLVY